jgi:hypothetical protein
MTRAVHFDKLTRGEYTYDNSGMTQLQTNKDIVQRLVRRVDELMDQHSGIENGRFPRVAQHYWVNRRSDKITQEARGIVIECPRLGIPHLYLGSDGSIWSRSGGHVDLKAVAEVLDKFVGLIGQAQDQGLTDLKISRKTR